MADWATQQWVRLTGRSLQLSDVPWLHGPVGDIRVIGPKFYAAYAEAQYLVASQNGSCGLLPSMDDLELPAQVDPSVRHFYENTSIYDMDAWSEWCGAFRPFGRLLALLFSRRLQQLNVPLSALDSSRGMTSEVIPLCDPVSGEIRQTAWIRRLRSTGNVLYAGSYSTCRIPGAPSPCVKVVFPLPNGSATVIMEARRHEDGSFSVVSAGRKFGDAGLYFVVHHGGGRISARYLRSLKESIHVFPGPDANVSADHELRLFGIAFLRLHYRMRRRS